MVGAFYNVDFEPRVSAKWLYENLEFGNITRKPLLYKIHKAVQKLGSEI